MLRNARRYFSTARRFVNRFYEDTKDPLFRRVLFKSPTIPQDSPWFLATHNVQTPMEANGVLVDRVFAHIQNENKKHTAPLLVLTALQLSRFNLLLPLQRVLQTFITTTDVSEVHFNMFLQALSTNPTASLEAADLIVTLLNTMSARNLKLAPQTYAALLRDRYVTLQLTKYLHTRMVQEGTYVPTVRQLENFLRVFAKNGAIHDARAYWEAIEATESEGAIVRANTRILSAQAKKMDAFEFLKAMKESKSDLSPSIESAPNDATPQKQFTSRPIYTSTAALHVSAKDRTTSTDRLVRSFLLLSYPTHSRVSHSTRLPARTAPTTATYTIFIRSLLHRNQPRLACIFFSKLRKSSLVVDNAALSAGMEAFVRNGEPHEAFALLEKYARKPGIPPVSANPEVPLSTANATSAQVESIQSFALSTTSLQKCKKTLKLFPRPLPPHQPAIRISTRTINNLLRALISQPSPIQNSSSSASASSSISSHNSITARHPAHHVRSPDAQSSTSDRHPRPDVALQLFTKMSTLYGPRCTPDSYTLRLVMKASLLGMQLDDTLVGKLRELGLDKGLGIKVLRTIGLGKLFPGFTPLPPFKTLPASMYGDTSDRRPYTQREQALLDILSIVGHPSRGGMRRYMSSMTQDGQSPVEFVRCVWGDICWAMGEQMSKLKGVEGRNVLDGIEPPAKAVRASPEDDAGDSGSLGFGLGLKFNPTTHTRHSPSNDTSTSSLSNRHPSLVPTPSTLHSYINLLGLASHAPDIPLTLAWMKELGVRPKKETLAVALVFWSEVTIGSPLRAGNGRVPTTDAFKRIPSSNESFLTEGQEPQDHFEDLEGPQYHALESWLASWVGHENMPGRKMMRHWRGVVRKIRT